MLYCIRCGSIHENEDNICDNCKGIQANDGFYSVNDGNRDNNYSKYEKYDPDSGRNSDYSIAGLTLGITSASAVYWLPVINLIVSIVALVLSVKGLKSKEKNKAVAGLITSIVGILMSMLMNIVWLTVSVAIMSEF